MSSQDFIQKHPIAVRIIEDEKLYFNLLEDPTIEPIIVILREGPMTLAELSERYNEYTERKIESDAKNLKIPSEQKELKKLLDEICYPEERQELLLNKEKLTAADVRKIKNQYIECKLPKDKKSETTVYRYVKKLEDVNIVFQVGRRIDPEGRTTKALYGRTAKIFIPAAVSTEYWRTPQAKKIINATANILSLILGVKKKDSSIECLKELMIKVDLASSVEVVKMLDKYNEDVTEITKDLDFKEMDKVHSWLGTLLLVMNSSDFIERIKDCYEI